MVNLVEMIQHAQSIPYISPNSENIDNWTNEEVLYKSIEIALHNQIQIKAGLYITSVFPPLKLIYKSILKQYINHFTKLNIERQNSNAV